MPPSLLPLEATVFLEEPPAETRQSFRYRPCSAVPMRLIVQPDFSPLRGWVFNLSTDGVGLLLYGKIESGKRIAIHVGNRAQSVTQTLLAEVVHCYPREDGRWLVGCRLVHPLGEEDVVALVDGPPS